MRVDERISMPKSTTTTKKERCLGSILGARKQDWAPAGKVGKRGLFQCEQLELIEEKKKNTL